MVTHRSCGILSSAPEENNIDPCVTPGLSCTGAQAKYECLKDKAKEKTDYCQPPAPVKNPDGTVMGWVVFVALCDESACAEGQDEIYYKPNVSRDEGFKDVAKPDTAVGGRSRAGKDT